MKYSVTVDRDGEGHSAFLVDENGKRQRLSPSWVRETFVDVQKMVPVALPEKGRFGKQLRMVPEKSGERLQFGESMPLATSRAVKALKLIAAGKPEDIKIPVERKVSK